MVKKKKPKKKLSARVPDGAIVVPPYVDIEGESLRWRMVTPAVLRETPHNQRIRWATPTTELINEFVRLGTPDEILDFARKWGPLYVDEYAMPLAPRGARGGDGVKAEPLGAWYFLSERAAAVMRLAKALQKGFRGADRDWRVLDYNAFTGYAQRLDALSTVLPNYFTEKLVRREKIAREVTDWLQTFRPGFRVEWHRGQMWKAEIDYHGSVLAVVALQLAVAVGSAEGLFTCDGCGWPYMRPNRKPNAGHKNYCPTCVENHAPQRAAERASRARKKGLTGK